MMEDRHEFYRAQAAAAQEQAKGASRDEDKAAWLKLAADWLGLIPKSPAVAAEQKFGEQVEAEGTRQDVPDTKQ